MALIVLAEDDQSMRQFLRLALTKAGHQVKPFEDGLGAYEYLKEHSAKVDLLLSDIVMPGMDGLTLSQKAQELRSELKVMFITGFAGVAMGSSSSKTVKHAQVLSKPFHLKDLVDQVHQLLSA